MRTCSEASNVSATTLSYAKELQDVKLSSSFPSQEYGLALRNVIEQQKVMVSIYQEKLSPVFSQMHQGNKEKKYVGMNVLIAKARGYNAEFFQSLLTLRQTIDKLSEANDKIRDGVVKTKTAKLIDSSKELTEKALSSVSTLREFLDVIEGYDKARVELNASFLTRKNEQRFNDLATTLHQLGEEQNEQGKNLAQLAIELNEILEKGSR